jgi:hypothetical protein
MMPAVAASPSRRWWALLYVGGALGFLASVAIERTHATVWVDGVSYYAYDVSLVLDGDLDLTNQYNHPDVTETRRTPTGLAWNKYPIGAPLLALPFFAAGHGVTVALRHLGLPLRNDGFSVPEQLAYGLGTIFWGFVGLALAVRLVGRVVAPAEAALSAAVWIVGSGLPYYLFKDTSYAHGCSFFAVTAFLAYDDASDTLTARSALVLGLLLGLMTLVENQNVLVGVVPLLRRWRQIAAAPGRHLMLAGLTAIGATLAFAPQLYVWWRLFGSPLAYSYGGEPFEPLQHLGAVLFSPHHGLVTWTPIAGLALVGLVGGAARLPALRPYLAGFLGQWLVNGSWWCWWFGASFGSRKFVSISAIFMIGLAHLVRAVGPRGRVPLLALVGLLIVGNVVLAFAFMLHLISQA